MQSNFDQSRPGEKPTEVESLLTAFYTEQPPDIDWANRLWSQLEPQLKAAPTQQPFQWWFPTHWRERNFAMRKDPPVISSVETGPSAKTNRRTLAGSLVGGLIMVTIVAGLLVLVSVLSSRGSNPANTVGSQPASYPDLLAGATLPPTPTLIPSLSVCRMWFSVDAGTPATTPTSALNQVLPTVTPIPNEGGQTPVCSSKPGGTAITVVPDTKPTPMATPVLTRPTNADAFERSGSFGAIPITFTTAALPDFLRATNPIVTFYGAKTDVSTAGNQAIKIVRVSGYSCTDSTGADNTDNLAKNLPIICTQAGKPDLYLSMSPVYGSFDAQPITPVTTGGTPITSAPPSLPRFYCYINGVAALEKSMYDNGNGYKSSLFIMSGTKLKEAFQNVTDPGAGATGCPVIK